jgi:hypothetical protein
MNVESYRRRAALAAKRGRGRRPSTTQQRKSTTPLIDVGSERRLSRRDNHGLPANADSDNHHLARPILLTLIVAPYSGLNRKRRGGGTWQRGVWL